MAATRRRNRVDLSDSYARVPTKFWSHIFCDLTQPGCPAVFAVKAESWRDTRSGEQWVLAEWARWADLPNPVKVTFRSAAVVGIVRAFPGDQWRPLLDAMLEECYATGAADFAARLEEVIRFTIT
jgi:hypothetical protein